MEPPFWNFTFPHLTFSHVHTSQVAQVHIFNEILSTVVSRFDLRKMIWTYGDLDSTQFHGAVISRGVLGSISPTRNSFFEKNIGFWDPFSGRILTEIPDLDDGSQVGFFSSGNGQKLASGPTALHFHPPFLSSSDF